MFLARCIGKIITKNRTFYKKVQKSAIISFAAAQKISEETREAFLPKRLRFRIRTVSFSVFERGRTRVFFKYAYKIAVIVKSHFGADIGNGAVGML